MTELPTELVTDILTRLPAKQVGRCKCVCRSWRTTIRARSFMDTYRKRHRGLMLLYWWEYTSPGGLYKRPFRFFQSPLRRPDDPPEDYSPLPEFVTDGGYQRGALFGVTQVINGLICAGEESGGSDLRLTLHSVFTGEAMRVPDPLPCAAADTVSTYHFGYDPVSKVYKLLRLIFDKDGALVKGAHIITLRPPSGPHTWRELDCYAAGISQFHFTRELGSFGDNGLLCWTETCTSEVCDRMLCFDLHMERFRLIDCPGVFLRLYAVTRFEDRLALWIKLLGHDYRAQDEIWCYFLEDDEGKKWSRHLVKKMKNYKVRDNRNLLLSSSGEMLELNPDNESWSVHSYTTLGAGKEKDDALFVGKLPHVYQSSILLEQTLPI